MISIANGIISEKLTTFRISFSTVIHATEIMVTAIVIMNIYNIEIAKNFPRNVVIALTLLYMNGRAII